METRTLRPVASPRRRKPRSKNVVSLSDFLRRLWNRIGRVASANCPTRL